MRRGPNEQRRGLCRTYRYLEDSRSLRRRPGGSRTIPTAVCICSADGALVRSNRRAAELWGRTRAGETGERDCGALRVYRLDGTPLLHAGTPMETALRTGEPQRDQELGDRKARRFRRVVLMDIEVLRNEAGADRGSRQLLPGHHRAQAEEQHARGNGAAVAPDPRRAAGRDLYDRRRWHDHILQSRRETSWPATSPRSARTNGA